jgi:hypothetical protein
MCAPIVPVAPTYDRVGLLVGAPSSYSLMHSAPAFAKPSSFRETIECRILSAQQDSKMGRRMEIRKQSVCPFVSYLFPFDLHLFPFDLGAKTLSADKFLPRFRKAKRAGVN